MSAPNAPTPRQRQGTGRSLPNDPNRSARDYLQPRREAMRAMSDMAKTPLEEAFLHRTFWHADPGTGRRAGSITEWSEQHGVGRNRMAECVKDLVERGLIRAHLPGGHDGWVELVGYHRKIEPSEWIAKQIRDARDGGDHVVRAATTRTDKPHASPRRARRGKSPRGSNDLTTVDESTGHTVDATTGEVVERAS